MNTAPNYEEAYEQMSDTNDPLWPFVVQSSGVGEPVVTIPRKQPITSELLDIIACQMHEIDQLREELGYTPFNRKRLFTDFNQAQGRQLGPTATMAEGGVLIVLES